MKVLGYDLYMFPYTEIGFSILNIQNGHRGSHFEYQISVFSNSFSQEVNV